MQFAFTEEQHQLRAGARRFLAECSSSDRVRAVMATDAGYDPEVWQRIGAELGWPALIVPEEYDGFGAGMVELVAVMELAGGALLCAPLVSSVCLGAHALLVAGDAEQKRRWLPGLAAGTTLATVAHRGEVTARRDGDGYRLTGTTRHVVDGHVADLVIVAADAPDGPTLFAVSSDAVERRRLPTMDQTRRLAEVTLPDVRVDVADRLGVEGSGAAHLARVLDLARIALAAEQVGVAQACLDMAVDYAKVRTQFGRPIGSFQAIKHKCADMLMLVEAARSAAYGAACAAADGDGELAVHAATAAAYCGDAAFACAAENIQIHGGIGFTWEHDAHLYFKRAKSSQSLLGAPREHRERVAQHILS